MMVIKNVVKHIYWVMRRNKKYMYALKFFGKNFLNLEDNFIGTFEELNIILCDWLDNLNGQNSNRLKILLVGKQVFEIDQNNLFWLKRVSIAQIHLRRQCEIFILKFSVLKRSFFHITKRYSIRKIDVYYNYCKLLLLENERKKDILE